MSIEYVIGTSRYDLSYQELKEQYEKFVQMSDEEFLANLPAAAHLACVICWLKEEPGSVVLGDQGIIHELIHLIHMPETCGPDIERIRQCFKTWCALA